MVKEFLNWEYESQHAQKNFLVRCKIILLIIFIFSTSCINAQQNTIDRLNSELAHAKEDSTKIKLLRLLAVQYFRSGTKLDSCIQSFQQELELVLRNKHVINDEVDLYANLDYCTNVTGNYSMSIRYANKST